MAKVMVDVSEYSHKELLKLQLERRLKGEKKVPISDLIKEVLDGHFKADNNKKTAQ